MSENDFPKQIWVISLSIWSRPSFYRWGNWGFSKLPTGQAMNNYMFVLEDSQVYFEHHVLVNTAQGLGEDSFSVSMSFWQLLYPCCWHWFHPCLLVTWLFSAAPNSSVSSVIDTGMHMSIDNDDFFQDLITSIALWYNIHKAPRIRMHSVATIRAHLLRLVQAHTNSWSRSDKNLSVCFFEVQSSSLIS